MCTPYTKFVMNTEKCGAGIPFGFAQGRLCPHAWTPQGVLRNRVRRHAYAGKNARATRRPRPRCRFQKISFSENWIWRDEPAVLLILPNPLPLTMFEGNPKFTMLNTLKNSARNSSVPISPLPR